MRPRVETWRLAYRAGVAGALADKIVRDEPVPVQLLAELMGAAAPAPRPHLTPAETEVLTALAQGVSLRELARRKGTSVWTVRDQRDRAREKFGGTVIYAVAAALRLGLIPPP